MSWFSPSTLLTAAQNLFAQITPYGTSRVSVEPSTLLQDKFDGASVDTTNRWTTNGTNVPTQSAGNLIASLPATNSLTSALSSQSTFVAGQGFKFYSATLLFDSGANLGATNTHRFYGAGQVTSFAFATPVTDGSGFEVDGTGAFNVVVYVGGTRFVVNSTNPTLITPQATLAASAGGSSTFGTTLNYPAGWTRLLIASRGDLIYFYANSFDLPVGVMSFIQPQVSALPIRMASVTNSAGAVTATGFLASSISCGDSASQNKIISDGVFPWRTAQVGARNDLITSLMDGNKATYSASVRATAMVVGDTFVLTGSATKTVRITAFSVTAVATAIATVDAAIFKRTAADTGGTPSAVTAIANDSNNAAPTATLAFYTAAPTPGAGTLIRADQINLAASATGTVVSSSNYLFGFGPRQAIVLRGVAQQFAFNIAQAPAGNLFSIDIEWTEE